MDAKQLSTILQREPDTRPFFKGVFSADSVLTFSPCVPCAIIINTDPSSQPGRHWVAIFIDNTNQGQFFDSYGNKPEYYHPEWNLWLSKWTKKWTYSSRVVQPDSSVHCGVHSLFFILHCCQGLSYGDIMELYTEDKMANDRMAEMDIEAHTLEDIVVDDSMFAINQSCCSKCTL
jgi:hypothetical protein